MMSPNDKIEELISAVGGVAEMCYDSCKSQGFTDTQAMLLTSQILRALFTPKSEGDAQ